MMEVISTRRYEARPPSASTHPAVLIDPESSVALVKEEEWETRKKKEITTTRQIETRVKRQVVLEDGEVVVDSGPLVTTNTTEDVEQQEHTTQERRTTGEKPQEVEWPVNGKGKGPVEPGSVVQKESNETVVRSREEIEERLETEDRQQLGDISDEAYQSAVKKNRADLRLALAESQKQLLSTQQTGPRVIQHTTKSNKVIDTEKTLERKELKADGLIVTERKCTVEHEEIKDDELPDDGKYVEEEESEDAAEQRKESSQRFVKKRDEDVVDYVLGGERVGREMRYVAETTEGERIGDWSPSATAMRTSRLHKHTGLAAENSAAARKDALTRKPLDLEEEDEARKFETSKWLESHFGSESRSSHGSIDADDSPLPTATNTSYINVTMRSVPPKDREYQNVNSSKQKQMTGRTSTSPSGYFHGISEWSERYQGREKQKNHMRSSSPPPQSQPVDTQYMNGHSHGHRNQVESTYSRTYESLHRREHQEPVQERIRTPSPPVRRRLREQWARSEEKTMDSTPVRTSSPVHVLQQTWESRSRDAHRDRRTSERTHRKKSTSISRSPSASPSPSPRPEPSSRDNKKSNETPNSRSNKSSGHSKYKIGESFRKLVDKLRSASTERKNKRASSSSASQLTQTDDNGPTYLQYNVIDKNIPLVNERDPTVTDEKPPERPPRSPRHPNTVNKSGKSVKSNEYVVQMQEQCQRSVSTPPLQRYYLGEDPFGGSIYGREKGYRERGARRVSKPRRDSRIPGDTEYSAVSSSLGRFSKSTSRLASDYEREEHFRSTQTLPRNLHSTDHNRNTNTRPSHFHHSALRRHHHQQQQQHHHHQQQQQQQQLLQQASHSCKHGSAQQISIGAVGGSQSRQYGSMINISIKNTVSAAKSSQNNLQPPPKPERTYKSSLARSKSFNIEAEGRNNSDTPPRIPYTSNLQLNRLGETTPLKSPGILASLSRSNRDLLKDRNEPEH